MKILSDITPRDTLLDLANYALMRVLELDEEMESK